jgi:hypothetical protein
MCKDRVAMIKLYVKPIEVEIKEVKINSYLVLNEEYYNDEEKQRRV